MHPAAVLTLLVLAGCAVPESLDIQDGTVSVTTVNAGGASHIIVACPDARATTSTRPRVNTSTR